jgi:hypothetical protein
MKYQSLKELKEAFETGELARSDNVLVIDNDDTGVWAGDARVFEEHPADLLAEALDLLDIPHEPA